MQGCDLKACRGEQEWRDSKGKATMCGDACRERMAAIYCYPWIPPVTAVTWFCSVLCTGSYHTRSVSEAEHLPAWFSRLADFIDFVLCPWYLCYYHNKVGYVIEFYFALLSVLIVVPRYHTRLFIPMKLLTWHIGHKKCLASGFTSAVCDPLNMHSSVSPAGPTHKFPLRW